MSKYKSVSLDEAEVDASILPIFAILGLANEDGRAAPLTTDSAFGPVHQSGPFSKKFDSKFY
jgi:hypothetical protein